MPKFYFPTFVNDEAIIDPEGTDIPDGSDARRQAIKSLCELASDRFPEATAGQALRVEVRDETRALLFEVCLDLRLPTN